MANRTVPWPLVALLLASAAAARAADAPAWPLGPFARPTTQPVLVADPTATFLCPVRHAPVHWAAGATFNPAATVRDGRVWVLYRAEDDTGSEKIGGHTSRLALASSTDGVHFDRQPAPVLYPADDAQHDNEWPGGCEDPRLVGDGRGGYVLTYTQWNGRVPHLAVATSPDLAHWAKHGPAFAPGTRYAAEPSKSAAILGRVGPDGGLVATHLNGRFWMYWGEGDVKLATSDDLVRWTTVERSPGHPLAVLPHRPGRFDGQLAEAGPPAVLTPDGIVVLYNGKGPGGSYAVGQARFDAADPAHLLDRPADPCFRPTEPWERAGQYAAGTTFAEGLVRFHDRWFLYYGCADSRVGVAVGGP